MLFSAQLECGPKVGTGGIAPAGTGFGLCSILSFPLPHFGLVLGFVFFLRLENSLAELFLNCIYLVLPRDQQEMKQGFYV